MNARRITLFAATVIAASFTVGTIAPASAATAPHGQYSPLTFVGTDTGYGATLSAAEAQARQYLLGDYVCKLPYYLVADGQLADGTWYATMSANCTAYR